MPRREFLVLGTRELERAAGADDVVPVWVFRVAFRLTAIGSVPMTSCGT
jgi:hypothetical protein